MIDLTNITAQIRALVATVEVADTAALDDEVVVATTLLDMARIGMRAPKILKECRSQVNSRSDDQKDYYEERGTMLCEEAGSRNKGDNTWCNVDRELWLTADGLLAATWEDSGSRWDQSWNTESRTIRPCSVADAVTTWGLDRIVTAVECVLVNRLNRLGHRSKVATVRAQRAAQIRASL